MTEDALAGATRRAIVDLCSPVRSEPTFGRGSVHIANGSPVFDLGVHESQPEIIDRTDLTLHSGQSCHRKTFESENITRQHCMFKPAPV